MVVKYITWLHEVVYSVARKPAAYELSMASFVQGYLIVMRGEEGTTKDKMAIHSEELMSDSGLYGWEKVRAYHGVWLNQLKQGWLTWEDTEEKLRFHWVLIWHPATSTSTAAST